MSRVGKKQILIPEGVEVKVEDQKIIIKGLKGELSRKVSPEIRIEIEDSKIKVFPRFETQALTSERQDKKIKALWGLTGALIANMIKGVTQGYEKKLEIEGVGFKAEVKGGEMELIVGFTNPVKIQTPQDTKFSVDKNIITVSGIDKELVGQIAAKIRKVRPAEPYKGKGIKYLGEVIRRKVGKKAITTTK